MKTLTLLCVCGPTATGKSELAFRLAKKLGTEIISFDSVQVYKELDIGSAKPPEALLKEVPHHLIGEIPPDQVFTAGDFRRRAVAILEDLKMKHKVVVLVGGTGFYLQALLKGMHDVPAVSETTREKWRGRLESEGLEKLYQELCALDPDYGRKIHSNDRYRVLRALEVIEASGGRTMTEIQGTFGAQELPFEVTMVGLDRPREILRSVIEARTEKMLHEGLVDETRRLVEKYGDSVRPLQSVGYKETWSFLQGTLSRDALPEAINKSTMALAKRQRTWFKREARMRWFDPENGFDAIAADVLDNHLHY